LRGEQDKLAHLHATARAVARKLPGQKIPQIKELRNLTDLGLKESKELIDAIWAKGLGDGGGAP
jgi:ribosomal protein L7/L12